MKYFAKEILSHYESFEEDVIERAHDDWEKASEEYSKYLESIRKELPKPLHDFLYGCCPHDAKIESMGEDLYGFNITLRLEPPFNDLYSLNFKLVEEPSFTGNFENPMYWGYEEIEKISPGVFKFSILFSVLSDWSEIQLQFSDVEVSYPKE